MLQFQQSETTAERRRWMLHLVDATDGITPETGVTGQGKITKNGAEPEDTTNSLVEVDSTEMPGFYYIELTQAELDTLGFIGLRFKTAATAEFQDRAIISYNDPYTSAGGFSAGATGEGFKLTKKMRQAIAEEVWKYQQSEEGKTALELLNSASEHPITDLAGLETLIKELKFPETDLSVVLDRIDGIQFPEIKDYTKMFADLGKSMQALEKVSVAELSKTVDNFTAKMKVATDDINTSLETVDEIKQGFTQLKALVEEFNTKVSETTDMDRRFEKMTSVMQKQELQEVTKKIDKLAKEVLLSLTNYKYDILTQLNQK